MAEASNTFLGGRMNKDLDERIVPQGEYRDAQNILVDISEGSNVGSAQNSLGNTLVGDIATVSGRDTTDARTIGVVTYPAGNKIYYFVAADYFDGIYEHDTEEGTTVRVLQCNKTNETTPSTLNFRKEYLITGVNHIIGPDGNNYLYWTDDYNPPRRVNISRVKADVNGLGGYLIDDDRIPDDINVILEPPMYAPHIELKLIDNDEETNNMEDKFLTFAYQYLYNDNQYSALSPFSGVAFLPKEFEYDYGVGNNKSMLNYFNSVRVSFETGNQFVKAVRLVVRDTKNLNVGIIDTIYKDDLNGFTTTGDSAWITFNNNKILAALNTDQVTRLFDNVPLLAKAQDVVGNRLAYGNYVQFRDIKDCNGDDISLDFRMSIKNPADEPTLTSPQSTWKSNRDYEFALLYSDEYGRLTTALTCDTNSIYVPSQNSIYANQIKMSIYHTAPCWATHYRIAVKESKGESYNIFPIIYYVDGAYRYFLLNDFDVNKVKPGDYITVKNTDIISDSSQNKYKVISVDVKPEGFLSNNNITELEGVYMKIKVNNSNDFPYSNVTAINLISSSYGPMFPSQASTGNVYGDGIVESPIHYGSGDPSAMTLVSNQYLGSWDRRAYIEIYSQTQFRVRDVSNSNWEYYSIVPGSIPITIYGILSFYIQFDTSQLLTVGDMWVVNCRGFVYQGNYYNGGPWLNPVDYWSQKAKLVAITYGLSQTSDTPINTGAVIRIRCVADQHNPNAYTQTQQFISDGDYVNIEEWFNESGAWQQFVNKLPDGTNVGAKSVHFRRLNISYPNTTLAPGPVQQQVASSSISDYLNNPIQMFIWGWGWEDAGSISEEEYLLSYSLEISQISSVPLLETEAKSTDVEIYHELSQTYPIDGSGNHIVAWDYDDFLFFSGGNTLLAQLDKTRPHYFSTGDIIEVTSDNNVNFPSGTYTIASTPDRYSIELDFAFPGSGPVTGGTIILADSDNQDQNGSFTPAIIEINTPDNPNCDYNAWSWGNGLESDRILDDFNATTLDFSPRAIGVVENYKQIRNDASICYSGVYNENTQYNRLNEFNLSLANFKYLDREFASIQKLHARDTDLLVFQENKLSSVLYGKNVLFDSSGGGQIVSIPEVLGTQVAFPGEYGISKNPESFAEWGNQIFFTDAKRGVVLSLAGDKLSEISMYGMRDYFRDLLKDNPTTQKLGAYDPHNHQYILSTNNQRSIPCKLTISRDSLKVPKESADYIFFDINTDSSWTITAVDTGNGTSWVSDYPTEGTGSYSVNGSVSKNVLGSNRSVNLVVTYCDGLTETFTLTQAKGKKGKVIGLVYNSIRK